LLGYETISEIICEVRLCGWFRNITFISAHASTEEKSEEAKEQFYEILGRTHEKIPKCDIIIILGDFNAKIRK
jgi:endonuclease/exonuclease/phosphatase family metal-dependent hydrolase